MKGRFFNELESYGKTIDRAQGFQFSVHLRPTDVEDTRDSPIISSAMPIGVLDEALEDLRLLDEGLALPIWDRKQGKLTIIPAKEILKVEICYFDGDGPVIASKD